MTIPQWSPTYRANGDVAIKDDKGRVVAVCRHGLIANYITTLHNTGGDRDEALRCVVGSTAKLSTGVR